MVIRFGTSMKGTRWFKTVISTVSLNTEPSPRTTGSLTFR
jgi:hypothetical protein